MATNGLVVMTPSSIAYSGTSASINADGSVTFSAMTSLSLNGVFTGDYDNYMAVITGTCGTSVVTNNGRLRASGVDATATNYTRQYLFTYGTNADAARESSQSAFRLGATNVDANNGSVCYFFGPYLAQPTAVRVVNQSTYDGAAMTDAANTHSLSTSYDGFTLYPSSSSMTGSITVFGFAQ